jgi:carboxypeptidase C (cathepsin A)
MVIGAGSLGDMPLHVLLANPSPAANQQTHDQIREMLHLDATQEQNFWAATHESNEHQLQSSRNSAKTLARPGSSHMFPYEHPEFVLDAVRRMIRTKARDAA